MCRASIACAGPPTAALRAIANPYGHDHVFMATGLPDSADEARAFPFFSIRASLAGANIFLTGGTGYLGQLLLEQLLRTVPDLGTVFVMSRNKKDMTARQRVDKWVLSAFLWYFLDA